MSTSNVHVSHHPLIATKISELRSRHIHAHQVRDLTSQIASLLAYEATSTTLRAQSTRTEITPINEPYNLLQVSPNRLCVVPILRSGLSMVEIYIRLLPPGTEVHHLGLFREERTLNAIEYYNKLPAPKTTSEGGHIEVAYIVDPIIATGNTICAAIQILKEWGVGKIVVSAILASKSGLERASKEWSEGTEFYIGAVDERLDGKGYIVPGLGDIGDRLYNTAY